MVDERRLTISSSGRLHPEEVGRRTFSSARRGFDQTEVRLFLEQVARDMATATDREKELRDLLSDAERRAANPVLDEATLTAALGQGTARVLRTAHDAAAEVLERAEADAEKAVAKAQEEAASLLGRAEQLAAERTKHLEVAAADAHKRAQEEATARIEAARVEGVKLVEQARDESRGMLAEAQQIRSRVLGDLTRRRRVLHSQIEQLRAGRERLAETISGVREAVERVTDDLFRAEDDARLAAEAAARQLTLPPDAGASEATAEEAAAEEAAAAEAAAAVTAEAAAVAPAAVPKADTKSPTERVPTADAKSRAEAISATDEAATAASPPMPPREVEAAPSKMRAKPPEPGGRVVAARPGPRAGAEKSPPPAAPAAQERSAQEPAKRRGQAGAVAEAAPAAEEPAAQAREQVVEELFARLRAERESERAPEPDAESDSEPDTERTEQRRTGASVASTRGASGRSKSSRDRRGRGPQGGSARDEAEDELSAGEPAQVPQPVGVAAGGEADEEDDQRDAERASDPFLSRRGEVLDPVVAALARRLKRALTDDQNDILDRLRANKAGGAGLLVPEDKHLQRYLRAGADQLVEAARAGATFAGGKADEAPGVEDLSSDLAAAIVTPLRRRLEGEDLGSETPDDAFWVEHIGAAFRDLKGTRIERLAGDEAVAAFSRAALAATDPDTSLRWIVDDDVAECPDCDDNALAGPVPRGDAFPTGHPHPPAHAGCRCLLAPPDA